MRAIQVVERGKPVQLREIDPPVPAPGEVRLRILAAGVNFADLLMAEGTYQVKPPLPFTLGMEVCGLVDALGDGVTSPAPGQRVAAYAGYGGMADFACLPATHCVSVPETMPSDTAAGFLIAYGTSHMALHRRARLQAGERLLVLGAGGGIGLTAVEIGRLMGAEVIAAARGGAKLEAARMAGADHLIDTDIHDLRETVKSLGGADVVYDPVGGELFKAAMRASNREARLLPVGFASGEIPQIPANILLVKNLSVIGFYWGGYSEFNPTALTDSAETLVGWFQQGLLKPSIAATHSLEHAAEALDLLRARKVVIRVAD
ncbi:MAG: NADPH:quinone oxidoreductase family protein [Rhodobacteraceae bacterium]|nr:NADPH:quinone oxidoreductase family protein [Paracoccaceae bacterium]